VINLKTAKALGLDLPASGSQAVSRRLASLEPLRPGARRRLEERRLPVPQEPPVCCVPSRPPWSIRQSSLPLLSTRASTLGLFPVLPLRDATFEVGLANMGEDGRSSPSILVEPDAGALFYRFRLRTIVDQPPHCPLSPTNWTRCLFHFGEDLQGRVVGPHASLREVRLTSSHNRPVCSQIARVGGLIPAPDTARHRAGALSRAAKAEYCQRCAGTSHDATKAAIRPISLGPAKNGAWP
jgi:hypothetical protein